VPIVTAEKSGALYYIVQPHQFFAKTSVPPKEKKAKRSDRKSRASLFTWHQRLGHCGYARVEEIAKYGLIHGLEITDSIRKLCIHCDMGKLPQHPANFFEAKQTHAPGTKLHGDIHVFPTRTASGLKYALIFTDDASRYSWVFLLKTREGLHIAIMTLTKLIFTQYKTRVKVIRFDNEFMSKAITQHLQESGIKPEYSPPYEKDFVGIAERANRTVNEAVRCMLHQAKMPKIMWGEAIKQAIFNKNRVPSKGIDGKHTTPYEVLTKTTPRALARHTFGCIAIAKVFPPGDKLDPRGEECIFLGVNENQNSFRLLSLGHKWKIVHCFSVSFHEKEMDGWVRLYEYAPQPASPADEEEKTNEIVDSAAVPVIPYERPRRTRRPYEEGRNERIPHTARSTEMPSFEPTSYTEAINCDASADWKESMQEELDSLVSQGTWKLVTPPKGAKIITHSGSTK
jgi:hypothetical protein